MLFREQGEHFRRELLGASVSFPPGNQLQERGLQGETQNRKILQQFSPVQCFRIFILCSLSPASEMESLSHLCRRGCSLSMFEIGRLTASNLRQNFFRVGDGLSSFLKTASQTQEGQSKHSSQALPTDLLPKASDYNRQQLTWIR